MTEESASQMMTEESVLRMTADINPEYSAEVTGTAAAEAEAIATGKDTDAVTGTAHAGKEKEATAAGKEAAAGTAAMAKEKGTVNKR